ncbi:hypothetical protein BG418_06095 [Streptomyces sp. CBMA152]|nr:hypothetical protein [Streptomyces sp. CBMA152]
MRATVTPVPNRPWYSPIRSAGARPKPSCQEPAECSISATTSSTDPARSAATATQVELPNADSAKTRQVANMTAPDRRTARIAVPSPVTLPAVRTWKSITAPVLRTNSAETSQAGAFVRSVIHSGSPRLSSGIRSSRTVLRRATTTYGRSRSTMRRPSLPVGTGSTAGSRHSSSAHTRKLAASMAKTVRYAPVVPARRATPPSAAPTASPALSVAWRRASRPVRSPSGTSPASSDWRAAASPDWAVA